MPQQLKAPGAATTLRSNCSCRPQRRKDSCLWRGAKEGAERSEPQMGRRGDQSAGQTLILPFIYLRTNVLGRLPKGHLPEPRFEDSAASNLSRRPPARMAARGSLPQAARRATRAARGRQLIRRRRIRGPLFSSTGPRHAPSLNAHPLTPVGLMISGHIGPPGGYSMPCMKYPG